MRSRAVPLVVAVLLAALVAPTGGGAAAPSEPANLVIDVQVHTDGNATWTVTARFPLDSQNETAAFRRLAREFERGDADLGFSAETFRTLAARASDRTGRDMNVTNVTRRGYVVNASDGTGNRTTRDAGGANATGVLELQFTWTRFADTSGRTIELGSAFGPAWELEAGQRLVLRPPAGYGVQSARPVGGLNNSVLTYRGPQSFDAGEPSVTYVESADPTDTPTPTTTPAPPDEEEMPLVGYAAGLLVALVGGGLVAYAWLRRDTVPGEDDERGTGAASTTADEGGADATSASGTDGGTDAGEAGEPAAGDTAAPGADGDVDTAPDGEPADEVDPELLSDEERVERLLRRNGGRMKQADIVTETDWSNAKVSQLLSGMDEEERIEKLRIGRENLITLVEEE